MDGRVHSVLKGLTQNTNLRRIVLPSPFQFLLPMHPSLALGVHKILVNCVLVREGAFHLTNVVVNLLSAVLIDRCTDGPDHTELEPQFHHTYKVLGVIWINLQQFIYMYMLIFIQTYFIVAIYNRFADKFCQLTCCSC